MTSTEVAYVKIMLKLYIHWICGLWRNLFYVLLSISEPISNTTSSVFRSQVQVFLPNILHPYTISYICSVYELLHVLNISTCAGAQNLNMKGPRPVSTSKFLNVCSSDTFRAGSALLRVMISIRCY
jgi:hypothetical protein